MKRTMKTMSRSRRRVTRMRTKMGTAAMRTSRKRNSRAVRREASSRVISLPTNYLNSDPSSPRNSSSLACSPK